MFKVIYRQTTAGHLKKKLTKSRIISLVFLLWSSITDAQNAKFFFYTHDSNSNRMLTIICNDEQELNSARKRRMEMEGRTTYGILPISITPRETDTAKSVYNLMIRAYKESQYLKASLYATKVVKQSRSARYSEEMCDAYMCIAIACQYSDQYDNALSNYNKAISFTTRIERKVQGYGNIAIVLTNIDQYHKALYYLNIADSFFLQLNRDNVNPIHPVWLTAIRAHIWQGLGESTKAIGLYDKALKICGDTNYLVYLLYHKITLLTDQNQNGQARKDLNRLLSYLQNRHLTAERKTQIYAAAGKVYYSRKDYKKATHYLQIAKASIQALLYSDQRALLHQLAHAYGKTGRYKEAFDLHIHIHRLEDDIKSKEVLRKVNEMETRYRTVAKDKQIAQQRLSNQAVVQKHYKEQLVLVTCIILCCLLTIILLILFYYTKQKKNKLEAEQRAHHLKAIIAGTESERNRIAADLHDGAYSTLAAANSYLQSFEHLYPRIALDTRFDNVKQLLSDTALEVRSIAHNLTSDILLKKGMAQALQEYSESLLAPDVPIEIQCYGQEYLTAEEEKLFLYRMAQDLLQKVIGAIPIRELIVMIGFLPKSMSLTLEFVLAKADNLLPDLSGELGNIREKVEQQKGRIVSELPKEKVIHISIPRFPANDYIKKK